VRAWSWVPSNSSSHPSRPRRGSCHCKVLVQCGNELGAPFSSRWRTPDELEARVKELARDALSGVEDAPNREVGNGVLENGVARPVAIVRGIGTSRRRRLDEDVDPVCVLAHTQHQTPPQLPTRGVFSENDRLAPLLPW